MRDIGAIILAGNRDFGRCPLASRMPLPLWPVLDTPVIQRLINYLSSSGIKHVVVCSNSGRLLTRHLSKPSGIETELLNEDLPLGTAGCLRDAADGSSEELLLVLSASVISPPSVDMLITAHCQRGSELSVVINPSPTDFRSAGIYVCDKTVLEHIPQFGYCDIKEWLIPEMLRKGKSVKTIQLPRDVGNFRDGPGYLRAVTNYLETGPVLDDEVASLRQRGEYWVDENADVDSSARIIGPVVVMANAQIAAGAVVFGPAVIGRNCRLGRDSIVANSILWDDTAVNENSEVQNCLLDYRVEVAGNIVVQNKIIPFEKSSVIVPSGAKALNPSGLRPANSLPATKPTTKTASAGTSASWGVWLTRILIAAAFVWSYWPGIVDLWKIWQKSDEYSSGLLVPFLAVYILWSRRRQIVSVRVHPSLWGFPAFVGAQAVRFFGLFFMYGSAERLSIVLSVAALVLLLFGWGFFRKVSAVLVFLLLMLPWPNSVQSAVTLPLQRWATSSAVFCLETIGYDVFYEGNIIHIGNTTVAVAEACNGLRMITAFFVINGLVVLLVKRNWWEKMIILVSSLPIALLCNTLRLAITAVAFTWLEGDYWEGIFHDFGGYAMMPVALAVVLGELWLLYRLTVLPDKRQPVIITRS